MDIVEKIEKLYSKEVLAERFSGGVDPKNVEDSDRKRKLFDELASNSWSTQAGQNIRGAYSRRTKHFWKIYGLCKLVYMGYSEAIDDERVDLWYKAATLIQKQIRGAFIESEFDQNVNIVVRSLRKIARNPNQADQNRKRAKFVGEKLRPLFMMLGSDKEIALTLYQDEDGVAEFPKMALGKGDVELSDGEKEAIADYIDKNFSNSIYRLFRRHYRADGWAFFAMYARLRAWEDGLKAIRRKEVDEFFEAIRFIRRKVDNGVISADLKEQAINLKKFFRKVLKNPSGSRRRRLARNLGSKLLDIIQQVANEKNIYFIRKPLKGKFWFKLNKARPKPEEMQKMTQDDPEHYALQQANDEAWDKVKDKIKEQIKADGLKVDERHIMGRNVYIGIDPATEGKGTETEEIVYDETGVPMPIDEWIQKRSQSAKSMKKMADTSAYPEDISKLRQYDDETIQQAMEEQTIEYKAITDDSGKSNPLTRVFPVVEINGEKVIAGNITERKVDGELQQKFRPTRFSGIVLDDMVNTCGRMIEGIAYDYNTETGVVRPIERGNDEMITDNKEPYITVSEDDRLYINVPRIRGKGSRVGRRGQLAKGYTDQRNALKDLQDSPFVDEVKRDFMDDPYRLYKCDPEAFLEIRENLQNFAMSEAAVKKLREQLKKAKARQDVLTKERLRNFSPPLLGGFKDELDARNDDGEKIKAKFKLNSAQLEALSYLDANGDKGICALETGVGKTVTAMAYIQNLKRKGVMREDDKVLYVAPSKLTNNLENQAKTFVKDYDGWVDQVVSLSSRQFLNESKDDPNYMDKFVAVIFDEATETIAGGEGGGKSKTSRAAQREHPRKVMLTASPMNKSPVELYTLNAIVNNVKIAEDTEERKKMFSFLRGYCEKLGGRYVSISKDPTKAKAMRQWVKSTMYFADKEDVSGYDLPDKNRTQTTVEMDAKVARKHKSRVNKVWKRVSYWRKQIQELDDAEGPFTDRWNREISREEWLAAKKTKIADQVKTKGAGGAKAVMSELQEINLMPGRYYKIQTAANKANAKWTNARTVINKMFTGSSVSAAANAAKISEAKAQKIVDAWPGDFEYETSEEDNPKANASARKIKEGMQQGDRFVLFTDSPYMAQATNKVITEKVGGNTLVALASEWQLWVDGQMVKKFTKKGYPDKDEQPPKPVPEGTTYDSDEWVDYIIDHWAKPIESDIHTVILTQSYSHGINLQTFNRVIHLDRNDWNSEVMKQRTARVWRQGQDNPVLEENLDLVYPDSEDEGDLDLSLDQIMKDIQDHDEQLFIDLIKKAKTGENEEGVDMEEGFGDIDMRRSSFYSLSDKLMELELSPYLQNVSEVTTDNPQLTTEGDE